MSETYTVWWIDDDKGRKEDEVKTFEENSDQLHVEFDHPDEIGDTIEKREIDPDLVLVDWFLRQASDFTGDGMSVEAFVREKYPMTPIYGFSSEKIDITKKALGNERFNYKILHVDELKDSPTAIRKDIDSYKRILEVQHEGVQGDEDDIYKSLFDCLSVPERDRVKAKKSIPEKYLNLIRGESEQRQGEILQFADWIRNEFLTTPGILYDKHWIAMRLGVREKAFEEYWETFCDLVDLDNFEYQGPFSHRFETLVWKSQLETGIINLSEDKEAEIEVYEPLRPGEYMLEVPESATAKCKVCGELYPETIAAANPGEEAKYPVHYRCSEIRQNRESPFEDERTADLRE